MWGEVLDLVTSFITSPTSLKTEFYAPSIEFSVLEVLPVLHFRSFHTYSLVFYLLLFLGFSTLHSIDLVLSFLKGPSLLKSESGWKQYHLIVLVWAVSYQFLVRSTCPDTGHNRLGPVNWIYHRWWSRTDPTSNSGLVLVWSTGWSVPIGSGTELKLDDPFLPPMTIFWISYKRGLLPHDFKGHWAYFSTPLFTFKSLLPPSSLLWFL
jgi:hypothetical protein